MLFSGVFEPHDSGRECKSRSGFFAGRCQGGQCTRTLRKRSYVDDDDDDALTGWSCGNVSVDCTHSKQTQTHKAAVCEYKDRHTRTRTHFPGKTRHIVTRRPAAVRSIGSSGLDACLLESRQVNLLGVRLERSMQQRLRPVCGRTRERVKRGDCWWSMGSLKRHQRL